MDSSSSTQQKRQHPEDNHTPRPVVWSEGLWARVREMRQEANVLRRLRLDSEAAARDDDADQWVFLLKAAEGDIWVNTDQAIEITWGAKADTIRSWARRGRVRAQKSGGDWLYHRDDLLRSAQEATAPRGRAMETA